MNLNPAWVDALLYKNWYWWGLDMVADGNALIYTAGVWYLLIPLLTGRRLFGANVVKTVIMVDLLVSMAVWSHHLLGDTSQPMAMRILSRADHHLGRVLYHGPDHLCLNDCRTIWLARPVQDDARPQVRLGSMFGFIMGGTVGPLQANVGLNLVFHNTQWIVALHAHTFLITGVGTMLFSVLYALVPMLTKLEFRSNALINIHFWLWMVGSVVMAYAMGMAVSKACCGALSIWGASFKPSMLVAIIGGVLVSVGFLAFLVNLIGTVGLRNVVSLFVPSAG